MSPPINSISEVGDQRVFFPSDSSDPGASADAAAVALQAEPVLRAMTSEEIAPAVFAWRAASGENRKDGLRRLRDAVKVADYVIRGDRSHGIKQPLRIVMKPMRRVLIAHRARPAHAGSGHSGVSALASGGDPPGPEKGKALTASTVQGFKKVLADRRTVAPSVADDSNDRAAPVVATFALRHGGQA